MRALGEEYQKACLPCQPVAPRLVDRLLAHIALWRCVLCGLPAAGTDLCIDCLNDLSWTGPACSHCAVPLVAPGICGGCQNNTVLDGCLAALTYAYPVPQMIAALKYRRIKVYGRVLGELLAIRVREALADGDIEMPDLLLPVPLHPFRQLARRFNQAELIARWLAHELGTGVAHQGLRRSKNTPRQTGKSRAERRLNLRGSFTAGDELSGKRIAVIDDVMTTGTTLTSIASVLKANGVRSVQGWVVARA